MHWRLCSHKLISPLNEHETLLNFKIKQISGPVFASTACVCAERRARLVFIIGALSPRFPLTDQTAIALSNPSGLWKHTPRYISFEEITGSLMKYADNKREREGLGFRLT